MKKFLALLLCISMILTLMPTVFATETDPTEDVTTHTETTPETTVATEAPTETTAATEAPVETTVETTAETTEATEEATVETTEVTEETTEPTEGESFTTFTTLDGNSVQVDDEIYIKRNQLVYKSMEDTEGHSTVFNVYKIKIKAIEQEGDTTWYRFENAWLNAWGYCYVKASSTSVTDPSDEEALVKEIQEIMSAFVDTVEELPEADAVATFDEAEQSYAGAYAMVDRDSAIPEDATEKYSEAYRAFAEAMGYGEDKEVSYPGTDLIDDLRDGVGAALDLLDEAEEKYASLNGTSTVATFAAEDDTGTGSVVDMDESYAAAKKKLDAILEAKPDLLEYEVEAVGNTDHKVESVAENIQMHLFNYGPQINNQQSGQGFLRFVHNKSTYGEAVDGTGVGGTGAPNLNKKLGNFPEIVDETTDIKKGLTNYLFDKDYRRDKTTADYYAAIKNNSNTGVPYSYHSIYFPIDNKDGSGTGLFQKQGDYFVYDSAVNAAWYNPESQKFEIYNYVLRPSYTPFISGSAVNNGNFLPFNKGHEEGVVDYGTDKTYDYKNPTTSKPEGTDVTAYRLKATDRANEADLWFGMTMEFDFYQPEGGKKNNNDMEFEFLGDDDVFVYIDNVLILDIGGTHGSEKGTINFATGAVKNPACGHYSDKQDATIYSLMKAALDDKLDESQFIDSDNDGKLDTFKDFTKHNLKFYYLERGGNISYCKLKFNMDPLPTGTVTLEKEVDGVNPAIAEDTMYTFTVTAKDVSGNSLNDMSYTLTGETGAKAVSSGGTVTLKANQKATFTKLSAGTTISFTETTNDKTSKVTWYKDAVVQSGNSVSLTIDAKTTQTDFKCVNTRKTGTLTIEKKVDGDTWETNDQFEICVKIGDEFYTGTATGASNRTVTFTNGKATISKDEKITITKIPSGMSYEVTETQHTGGQGYKYEDPKYVSGKGTIVADKTSDVTITNTLKLLYGNLVITKSGIDSRDHYGNENYGPNSERQSTIYTIFGTSNSGVAVNMQVVIVGNGSVTIQNIPVGTYTVTENMNWAWRYENSQSVNSVTITGGQTTETSFDNTRAKHYWLSGDAYCRNQWK